MYAVKDNTDHAEQQNTSSEPKPQYRAYLPDTNYKEAIDYDKNVLQVIRSNKAVHFELFNALRERQKAKAEGASDTTLKMLSERIGKAREAAEISDSQYKIFMVEAQERRYMKYLDDKIFHYENYAKANLLLQYDNCRKNLVELWAEANKLIKLKKHNSDSKANIAKLISNECEDFVKEFPELQVYTVDKEQLAATEGLLNTEIIERLNSIFSTLERLLKAYVKQV